MRKITAKWLINSFYLPLTSSSTRARKASLTRLAEKSEKVKRVRKIVSLWTHRKLAIFLFFCSLQLISVDVYIAPVDEERVIMENIYLLFGEEKYLIDEFVAKAKKEIEESPFGDMNITVFDEKNIEAETIIDAFQTVPFMAEKRLVIVKNLGASEKIAESLGAVPPSTILIIVEEIVDKRTKFYKAVNKIGACKEFKTPKESELISWVRNLFSAENKEISIATANFFIRTVAYNMENIKLEAEKLIAYKGDLAEITVEDIELVSTKSLEAKVFDLLKAVGEKKLSVALDIYSNMLANKEQPIMLLVMLARQFKLMLRAKALVKENLDIETIASRLDSRSFIVRDCLAQAKNFKFNALVDAINELWEMDVKIKTGQINAQLGVEVFIIKYGS